MLKMKQVAIGGTKYELAQIPSLYAIGLLTKIIKIIGEPAAVLFASSDKKSLLEKNVSPELMGMLMSKLMNGVDVEEIQDIIEELSKYIKVNIGKDQFLEIDLDVHFGGNLLSLFSVLKALLEHNYSDFLSAAESLTKEYLPAERQGKSSENTPSTT